jgi:chromosome segregation ATPase
VNERQNESLLEWIRLSKENGTCCNHEDEIAYLKRSKDKLMVIKLMQDEALKEYQLSSKDHTFCNHEDEIATLERHKRLLLRRNSLLEEALSDHEDEVNHLKSEIESLQVQIQFLEGFIEAYEDLCNEG